MLELIARLNLMVERWNIYDVGFIDLKLVSKYVLGKPRPVTFDNDAWFRPTLFNNHQIFLLGLTAALKLLMLSFELRSGGYSKDHALESP